MINVAHVGGNILTISSSSSYAIENKDFLLHCTTKKVLKGIIWTRNGTRVAYMYVQSDTCGSIDAVSGLYLHYKYNCTDNTTYHLIIPGGRISQENGSKWQCKDSGGDGESDIHSLEVAVSPTSDPEVTGYNGAILNSNVTATLTCTVRGGTPLAVLSWTCRGSSVTATNKSTSTSSISVTTLDINSSFDGQTCVCRAEHLLWVTNKTAESPRFVVYFAPNTTPVISGYKSNQIIYETEQRNVTCTVFGGNPIATITWTCRDFPVNGSNQSVNGEARSTLTLDIDRHYNNQQCVCEAVHPTDNYNRQISVSFTVYYPPSAPIVTNNFTTFPWIEEGNGTLLCTSTPGNPLSSSYQWKINGILVSEQYSQTINFTDLTRKFNMRNISCREFNDHSTHKNQQLWSPSIQLNVEYSPIISVGTAPAFIIEGEDFTKECTAIGNPKPYVTWKYGHYKSAILQFVNTNRNLTGNYTCEAIDTDLTIMAPNETFDNTQDIQLRCNTEGNHSGIKFYPWTHKIGSTTIRQLNGSNTVNQSVLHIPYSSYQDVGRYTCYAYNRYGKFIKSKNIEVTVKDKPVITETIKMERQNQKEDITVDFYSIPKPLKVEWLKEGSILSLSEKYRQSNTIVQISLTVHNVKVTHKGYRAQLTITKVTEADYVQYTLRIENNKGSAIQEVDFQREEKKDFTIIGVGLGVSILIVIAVPVVTIIIVVRYRRKNRKEKEVELDVKDELKYEDLQTRRKTNVYDEPVTQGIGQKKHKQK